MERRIDAGALYTLHDYIRQVINASFDLFAIFFVLGGALDDAVITMMYKKAHVSGCSQVRCRMIIKNVQGEKIVHQRCILEDRRTRQSWEDYSGRTHIGVLNDECY